MIFSKTHLSEFPLFSVPQGEKPRRCWPAQGCQRESLSRDSWQWVQDWAGTFDDGDDGDDDDDDNGNPKPNMIILGHEARTCEDSGMQVERWTEVQTSKKRG